jgi:hypothetical protein
MKLCNLIPLASVSFGANLFSTSRIVWMPDRLDAGHGHGGEEREHEKNDQDD